VVLAVGAWAPSLYGGSLPLPLYIERRVLYWFRPDAETQERGDFSRIPVYIWDMGGAGNWYGFPSEPGTPAQVGHRSHYNT
jgi:hypothetical protein